MKVAVAGVLNKPILENSKGGTEVFTYYLVKNLVKKGHDVTLFATSDSKTDATSLESVCSSLDIEGVVEGGVETRYPYHLLQSRNIALQSDKFDVVHSNYYDLFLIDAFSSFVKCPLITTVHNNFWQFPKLNEILRKTQKVDNGKTVFVSKSALELAGNPISSQYIYNGIDIDKYPLSESHNEYVLWLGRMIEKKGAGEAVKLALKTKSKLFLNGYPPVKKKDKEYFEKSVKPYLSDKIQLKDSANTQDEKVKLYQGAKAFVFPIQWEEPFGLVMLEAMSCGVPVVAYNRGAVPEVIKDGVTGFIVDPDDEDRPGKDSWIVKEKGVDGLATALNKVSEIDRAMCSKHVRENFTLSKMVDNYEKLYMEMTHK